MDIVTHAIAGAAVGAHYGHPILGALVGVAPDLPLGLKRRDAPNDAYLIVHAPVVMLVCAFYMPVWVTLAWFSHIALDAVTHHGVFAVRPFAPFSGWRLPWFTEWEFFNRAWWGGALITAGWVLLWLPL